MNRFMLKQSLFILVALAGAFLVRQAQAAVPGAVASSEALLPVPTEISSGSTVELLCGRTYIGTLNLVGKYGVRVRTEGECGKARLSPGRPVTGWTRHKGNIYSAPLDFTPVQVTIGGEPLELAHYPNKPQIWAKGKSPGPYELRYKMPDDDIVGALLVYRANDWLIETRPVKDYVDGMITLAPKTGDAIDPPANTEFYVEGKLWMLDAPGEWALSRGRLYVWARDGRSPEGRVWASPKASGIDATDSKEVSVDGVGIFSAAIGIDGSNSTNLKVRNTEIVNSAEDGIFAGGTGLVVDNVRISNAVQNGIYGFYGITDSIIANSTITSTGMVGMPRRSKGGIVFEQASGQRILNNKVLNSSYIGIRVHKNAIVSGNLIDGACLVLTDCGGIYTFAPDRQPLNVRIENNTIRNLAQRQAYAVYLDDNANGVAVQGNTIVNNPGGLELHNGFNNVVTRNVFSGSRYEDILMNETTSEPSIHDNWIAHNVFVSTRGEPVYRLWSHMGGANVGRFAFYDNNVYTVGGNNFAEVAGTGMVSYRAWKAKMKQDDRSTLKGRGRGKAADGE